MATDVKQFDALRLSRDAESAGQVFGFEDTEAGDDGYSRASVWMIRVGCVAIVATCLLYSLV